MASFGKEASLMQPARRLAEAGVTRKGPTRSASTATTSTDPWRLQAWMGHKRIDETMLYVHVAEAHYRELPEVVRLGAMNETDPDTRILRMLGARGSHVAAETMSREGNSVLTAV